MQNQQKNSLPAFQSVSSIPTIFLNFIFGLFWVFFVLFFITGMVYLLSSSFGETGLDEIATVILFFIFFIALSGIVILLLYARKKMFTTTVIDEKGIHYLNKFNGSVVKELSWNNFAKKEEFTYLLGSPKFDITSRTPMKSIFDQFAWPILIDKKVVIHTDAFLGKHFFCMFYSNRTELIRGFLLGIACYRPDITIDPAIFANHYINAENYIIDYRKRRITQILGFAVCAFILALSYYFVFH